MADDGMVSSGADLASSFSPDAGSAPSAPAPSGSVAVADAPPSPDTQGGDEIDLDSLNDTGIELPVAEEVAEEAPDEALPAEELPEGVRKGKDRKGRDGFWLEPNRYETFHGAHKTLREIESVLGEPFSMEAIQLREKAHAGQERFYNDFLSGDPVQQGKVVQHLLDEARRAMDQGEVGIDPVVPFIQQMYGAVQKSNPQAYAQLRLAAANDLVDEMYREAAEKGNRALWLSAQHFDKTLGRKWRAETDMANFSQEDPLAQLRAENERLRNEILTGTASNQSAQFDAWKNSVNSSISQAVTDSAVLPALESVKESYSKFPDSWKAIQDRLHSHVLEGFRADERFAERVKTLIAQARRAPSEQRRREIGDAIKMLHANKAKLIVDAHKATVIREAGTRLKEQSDRTHQRHQAAQTKQAPAGGGTPVPRSLVPTNGDAFGFDVATPDAMAASLRALFKR